jgi:hypothetical protein
MAQNPDEEVRAFITAWYQEFSRRNGAGIWDKMVPDAIVAPSYPCQPRDRPQPRALKWKGVYPHLLARRAQRFAHEIQSMRVEPTLARVSVWERGWIYAWAAKQTYENAAAATFVLEKRNGEGWKVVLYASEGQAVRPEHQHEPMPNLAPVDP